MGRGWLFSEVSRIQADGTATISKADCSVKRKRKNSGDFQPSSAHQGHSSLLTNLTAVSPNHSKPDISILPCAQDTDASDVCHTILRQNKESTQPRGSYPRLCPYQPCQTSWLLLLFWESTQEEPLGRTKSKVAIWGSRWGWPTPILLHEKWST